MNKEELVGIVNELLDKVQDIDATKFVEKQKGIVSESMRLLLARE